MQQVVQLFVNDEIIDLFSSDDEPVQLVVQSNNLGDLNSIESNYTKRFNIPLTKRNKLILGNPGEIFVYSPNSPYNYYAAKLVYAGIEVIPNGKMLIMQVNNDSADVAILSGNYDFTDLLNYQIYDMGDSLSPASGYGTNLVWKQWEIPTWDVPTVANSQQKTEGWIWPVINYGDISSTPPFDGFINVRNQRPAFFVKTAIETLIQSTGYSIDKSNSCLYNNPKYYNLFSKLLIPFSNSDFEHGTDYQNTPAADAMLNNTLSQQFIYNGSFDGYHGTIPFNQPAYGPVTKNVNGKAEVVFDFYLRGRATGSSPSRVFVSINVEQTLTGDTAVLTETSFDLSNFENSVHDGTAGRISGNGSDIIAWQWFRNNKITVDCELVPGMKIGVGFGVIDTPDTGFIVPAGSSFSFIPSEQNVLFGQSIQVERILPDIGQLDLLKFVLRMFGLICNANPNTGLVRFYSFADIVSNMPLALDWSDKCLDMGKQVIFNLGNNYGQINWFRYQNDDSIPINFLPKYFADENIKIDDKTLNPLAPVQELYQSPFAPSINVPFYGGTIAQISSPTNTDKFSVGNQPRLMIDQKLDLRKQGFKADNTQKTVTFADADQGFQTITQIVNDIISTPYFFKNDAPDLGSGAASHLCWNDKEGMPGLISTYYGEFAHILKNTKKITRFFYLTPQDIYEFDNSIPVYIRQESAYFYVNKIDSWSKGNPCKVELIRL